LEEIIEEAEGEARATRHAPPMLKQQAWHKGFSIRLERESERQLQLPRKIRLAGDLSE
jgi:hypothetical protein